MPNDNSTNLPEGFVRSSRTIPVLLAAAGSAQSIQRLPYSGSKFYIVDADTDAAVGIKTDSTSQELFTVGTGKDFEKTGDNYFKSLEIENFEDVPVELFLFAGFGEYIDKRTTIVGNRLSSILPTIEPNTEIRATIWETLIPASGTLDLSGIPDLARKQLRRKCLVVSNDDPSTVLQILDDDSNVVAFVQPKTEVVFPVSKRIMVLNPTGSDVSGSVSEIWWLKP